VAGCWLVGLLDFSSTLKMEALCSSERPLLLNGLHGVISQKTILFITTAVKTSNPTYERVVLIASSLDHIGPSSITTSKWFVFQLLT
jgi:hypothetical protein